MQRASNIIRLSKLQVFALALGLLLSVFASPFLNAENEQDFRQQAALAPGGSVTVENGRGDVSLEGWDKAEILIEAHKFFEGDESKRAQFMRDTKIRFEGDEHHRLVKVEYPHEIDSIGDFWGNGRRGVNLTIHLPRRVNADLQSDRGHLNVRQIEGKVDIACDRGDVDIAGLDGELRLHGDRGRVKMSESAIRNGLHLSLDRGSADIRLKQFAGESEITIDRGDLSLWLPEKAAFTLDAERSRRSGFRSDFPVLARDGLGSNRIRGDVNGGGPTLRLRGDRGNVWLRTATQ